MPTERCMKLQEVAAFLRVEVHTIYRMTKAGQFPAFRVGRQWRIRERDLLGWLATQEPAASASARRRHSRPRGVKGVATP